MFDASPKARADLKPGTLYAVTGERGWVYYGQVAPDKSIGFFRRRDRQVRDSDTILSSPVMAVVSVAYPSITKALRSGKWFKLGRFQIVDALRAERRVVQWPVGTLNVIVWEGAETHETRVEDPAIQELELMASWDAEHHIPARLTADFGVEPPQWHVGGPIWRERRVKEETAKRASSDQPWHQLPPDWVGTDIHEP